MISQAAIHGRSHRLMQQNSHDFAITGTPSPDHAFGLVLDGCGSKYADSTPSHNEVGAKLLGQFAATWLGERFTVSDKQLSVSGNQVAVNGEQSVAGMLLALHQDCVAFLRAISAAIPWCSAAAKARFVSTHLLTTLLGFVVTPATAVCFWQGDGYLVHNGDVTTLDSHNRPDYLGYRVLTPEAREEAANYRSPTTDYRLPITHDRPPTTETFHTCSLDRSSLQWLAVATDGWQAAQLAQLNEPRSSLQLQRWLNVQARTPGSFEDDGAVAIWWQ